jgi:hypothetical protein
MPRKSSGKQITQEIAALQSKLALCKDEQKKIQGTIAQGAKAVDEIAAALKEANEVAAAMDDPAEAIVAERRKLQQLETDRKRFDERRVLFDQVERLAKEASDQRDEHAKQEMILDRLRGLRQEQLHGVDFGIEGLSFGDDGLMLKSIPFTQASRAQIIRVAAAVGMKRNPRARVLLVDNAECNDAESRAVLEELSRVYGFQIWEAMVSDEPFSLRIFGA